MKVAITCDYLISRNHYTEIIETLCELFPEARIYTLVHKKGALLGRVEQRRITSSHLSETVFTEEDFYKESSKLPFLAKNLFVSCEYDLIVNVSRGLSHGFKKCDKSKQLTYLYDLGFEGKVRKSLLQKLTYPFLINYFVKSLKQADFVFVSREDLKKDLEKYKEGLEVVAPPFKITDYSLFPKDMFKHHFYLIETKGLSEKEVTDIISFMNETKREFQFIGDDFHLKTIKEKYPERPNLFFGNRCSGEHAPVLASSKMFISFNEIDFPKWGLATLAVGRPILVPTSQDVWIKGNGVYHLPKFDLPALATLLNDFEKVEADLVPSQLRALVNEYHEVKFKAFIKRFVEKNFNLTV
jgi:hypothetical protein